MMSINNVQMNSMRYCRWFHYRTVAVDMRGYGDSDKPSGIREYTIDKLLDDINQLITELGSLFFVFCS